MTFSTMNPRFTYRVFNALLVPVYPLLAGYLLWRRYVQKRSAASARGQLGYVPAESLKRLHDGRVSGAPVIWLHAVSVGEQIAARPVARALKEAIPGCRIALSVTTDTGFQTARSAFESGGADALFYFPLDLPFAVSRALSAVRPDVFITMETELWPNFLHLARARKVLCFLANGRVSDNLLQRAAKTKWLWRWMLSNLNSLLMRSEFDAERMREIIRQTAGQGNTSGARTPEVLVTGDVKLDGLQSLSESQNLCAKWRKDLGIEESELLWVCGSTHPGEEALALEVFAEIQKSIPQLKLLLAPRHIERVGDVAKLIEAHNFPFARRSDLSKNISASSLPKVLLLDTVGELAEVYAAADLAFVGGSLIPRGGHNLLEPLLKGVPVLFGPHTANFRAHAELIQAAKLGDRVQNKTELAAKALEWLENEQRRSALPLQIEETLAPHQGAPARIASRIAAELAASQAEGGTR